MGNLAAFFHDELHDRGDVFVRDHDEASDHRLADFLNHTGVGKLVRIVDAEDFPVCALHLVDDRGVGGDDVHVELAAKALEDDLHVEQAEESTTEAEAEGDAGLGHELERGIVELKFGDGGLEAFEVSGVDRVDAAEDHRLNELKSGERPFGGLARAGECVSDLHLGGGFDVRNDITDVTGEEFFAGKKFGLLGLEDADLLDLVVGVGGHQFHRVARFDGTLKDTSVNHHASVSIEVRVEGERLQAVFGFSGRMGDACNDGF